MFTSAYVLRIPSPSFALLSPSREKMPSALKVLPSEIIVASRRFRRSLLGSPNGLPSVLQEGEGQQKNGGASADTFCKDFRKGDLKGLRSSNDTD